MRDDLQESFSKEQLMHLFAFIHTQIYLQTQFQSIKVSLYNASLLFCGLLCDLGSKFEELYILFLLPLCLLLWVIFFSSLRFTSYFVLLRKTLGSTYTRALLGVQPHIAMLKTSTEFSLHHYTSLGHTQFVRFIHNSMKMNVQQWFCVSVELCNEFFMIQYLNN